jgi:hypothetical protein
MILPSTGPGSFAHFYAASASGPPSRPTLQPNRVDEQKAALMQRDEVLASIVLDSGSPVAEPASPDPAVSYWKSRFEAICLIGRHLGIWANGLHGYYHRGPGPGFEGTRSNLISVVCEGKIRPARGYASGGATMIDCQIDAHGNLRDGEQTQAFVAQLRTPLFGPYWVLLDPAVVASDRAAGIPQQYHRGYLVPEEVDRQVLTDMAWEQVEAGRLSRSEVAAFEDKIVTYDEFIAPHQDELDQWRDEHVAAQVDVRQLVAARMEVLKTCAAGSAQGAEDALLAMLANDDILPEIKDGLLEQCGYYGSPLDLKSAPAIDRWLEATLLDPLAPDELKCVVLSHYRRSRDAPQMPRCAVASVEPLAGGEHEQRVRFLAIDALHVLAEQVGGRDAMARVCADTNAAVRRYALIHLALDQQDAPAIFLRHLNSSDPQDRVVALYALSEPRILLPAAVLERVEQIAAQPTREDERLYANAVLHGEGRISRIDGSELQASLHAMVAQMDLDALHQRLKEMMPLLMAQSFDALRTFPSEWEVTPILSGNDAVAEYFRLLMQRLRDAIRAGQAQLAPIATAREGDLALVYNAIAQIPAGGMSSTEVAFETWGGGYPSTQIDRATYARRIVVGSDTGIDQVRR